jgi:hypothetical protein
MQVSGSVQRARTSEEGFVPEGRRYIMRLFGVLIIFSGLRLAFSQATDPPNFAPITPERILQHIRTLASDDVEGRGPGSEGETKTIEYLIQQFRTIGTQPGNPDGTYLQRVPISMLRTQGEASFHAKSRSLVAVPREGILVYSYRARVGQTLVGDGKSVIFSPVWFFATESIPFTHDR